MKNLNWGIGGAAASGEMSDTERHMGNSWLNSSTARRKMGPGGRVRPRLRARPSSSHKFRRPSVRVRPTLLTPPIEWAEGEIQFRGDDPGLLSTKRLRSWLWNAAPIECLERFVSLLTRIRHDWGISQSGPQTGRLVLLIKIKSMTSSYWVLRASKYLQLSANLTVLLSTFKHQAWPAVAGLKFSHNLATNLLHNKRHFAHCLIWSKK